MSAASFPALLQRFFTERLVTHQDASGHTVAAYRDTFRLLLRFVPIPAMMNGESGHRDHRFRSSRSLIGAKRRRQFLS